MAGLCLEMGFDQETRIIDLRAFEIFACDLPVLCLTALVPFELDRNGQRLVQLLVRTNRVLVLPVERTGPLRPVFQRSGHVVVPGDVDAGQWEPWIQIVRVAHVVIGRHVPVLVDQTSRIVPRRIEIPFTHVGVGRPRNKDLHTLVHGSRSVGQTEVPVCGVFHGGLRGFHAKVMCDRPDLLQYLPCLCERRVPFS